MEWKLVFLVKNKSLFQVISLITLNTSSSSSLSPLVPINLNSNKNINLKSYVDSLNADHDPTFRSYSPCQNDLKQIQDQLISACYLSPGPAGEDFSRLFGLFCALQITVLSIYLSNELKQLKLEFS